MRPQDLVRAALPVVLGVALGALGGWLWWAWWGPAPKGKVFETSAGPTWYPDPFDPGITRDFTGTAMYVVVGFCLAAVLGVVAAWLCRSRALAGLVALGLATVAAAAIMALVGAAQSPPDPQDKVDEVDIGTALPGHLEVGGWTPYLAWPVGGLLGYLVVMVSLAPVPATAGSSRPGQPSAEPARLD